MKILIYLSNIQKDYNYNVMKCIQENMNDETSRYLLLIIDSSLSQELLNYILEEINEENNLLKYNNITKDNNEKDYIELFTDKDNKKKEICSSWKFRIFVFS